MSGFLQWACIAIAVRSLFTVCAISGHPLNEHNLPMMLPNGYVYGEQVSFTYQSAVYSKCTSSAWHLLTSQSASKFLNCISEHANTWYVHVLIISYYCFRPWSRWLLKTMVRSFAPKQKRFIHSKSSRRCLWCKYCKLLLLLQSCRSMILNSSILSSSFANDIQGGSNMTGNDLCVNKPHMSWSYLNHLVYP